MRATVAPIFALLTACTADVDLEALDSESDASESEDDADDPESAFRIAPLANFSKYCSIRLDAGGYAFRFGTSLPCNDIFTLDGPGTILHAGRYDAIGLNNVVARCDGIVWWGRHYGDTALAMAKSYAQQNALTNCNFNVAPAKLPIFSSPWSLNPPPAGYALGRPFNFASYGALDVGQFGQPSANATYVDYLGVDRTAQYGNDGHLAWDYLIPPNHPITAVADGVVIAARFRDLSYGSCGACSAYSDQAEVLIEHTVQSSRGDLYAEKFVSYYAHMWEIDVEVGDFVTAGQQIGLNGSTGCSSAPHLHFGVLRLSNTNTEWYDIDFDASPDESTCTVTNSNGDIDPYGWWPNALGFDPIGLLPDRGAMSIDLWKPGHAPPY